jgi:hypothetical protein
MLCPLQKCVLRIVSTLIFRVLFSCLLLGVSIFTPFKQKLDLKE